MKLASSILVVGGIFLLACTANTVINADLTGRGNVPANETEVSACKSACTTRSKCEDATPSCETSCDASSSDDAVAFKNCVDKSACDPACDAMLDGSGPTTTDASTAETSTKDAGTDAKADAASTGDNLTACNTACDDWKVVECIEGSPAQCKSMCSDATSSSRGTFASCTTSSTTCQTFANCWNAFSAAP
jgi:hypothetical protein